ncbi:hypothetical protein B7C51_25110 (plasmid) [Paenibacillus larvae subsp. pulvifaciens]|uniref:Uncharacterized protein n=1 Tax=Paenibacillus larvae subsp. pulvifaciens TaxID=1477 RepID=A0A1V0UZY4_9BACL|nr:AAA family ATPase [Paenibacillus larvae]ARF70754.1 hypothetical protein B7C51_25110 [Paenibacillus larvae subsp. pulvifaciens]
MSNIIEVEIKVEQIIVYKEESSWGLYGCIPVKSDDTNIKLNKYGNMAVNGVSHKLEKDCIYQITAEEVIDPKYGPQYKIIRVKQDIPTTPERQKEFLRALTTELQHKAIYDVYEGCDVISLIKTDQFDYKKVKSFGEHNYQILKRKVLQNLELQELINDFPETLNFNILRSLLAKYSSAKILGEKLRENPYIITEVRGVGFKKADEIALALGIATDSPERLTAGILYVLYENENNGDTYITEKKLLSKAFELLKVKKTKILSALENVPNVINLNARYALETTYNKEIQIAEKLIEIEENSKKLDIDIEKFLEEEQKQMNIKLTERQKKFFYEFAEHNITLLIGFAGCGKTMIQKLVNKLIEKVHLTSKQMAPTGKAAKVMEKYTGKESSTFHRSLPIHLDEDMYRNSIITDNVILVDESSMCGIDIINKLLKAVRNDVRIVFVGDSFQLPSVDCGNFLHDIIRSGVFSVTMLDQVFRQDEGGILDIVTRVRNGLEFIDNDFVGVKKYGDNCYLVACPQEEMERKYFRYFKKIIKKYSPDDIMTLTPTKKGNLGTHKVNNKIQSYLNRKTNEEEINVKFDNVEVSFRKHDLVINVKNSYNVCTLDNEKINIMNGDIGIITSVNKKENNLIINFDGKNVIFKGENIRNIRHSYCLTMHKSQGSSAKSVLSITDKSHTYQLNANLLYTAWSRSEELLVIMCQPKVINRAIKKVENMRRCTMLQEILIQKKNNLEKT